MKRTVVSMVQLRFLLNTPIQHLQSLSQDIDVLDDLLLLLVALVDFIIELVLTGL